MLKKYMQKLKKDQRGLTLVELLAVVVILAIVAAIAFVVIGNVIDNSKKDAQVANAQQMISAAKLYESSGGKFDDTSGTVKLSELQTEGTMSDITDPWDKGTHTPTDNDKVVKEGKEYKAYLTTTATNGCGINGKTSPELNDEGRDACK